MADTSQKISEIRNVIKDCDHLLYESKKDLDKALEYVKYILDKPPTRKRKINKIDELVENRVREEGMKKALKTSEDFLRSICNLWDYEKITEEL